MIKDWATPKITFTFLMVSLFIRLNILIHFQNGSYLKEKKKNTNAVYSKEDKTKWKNINLERAEDIFYDYLQISNQI